VLQGHPVEELDGDEGVAVLLADVVNGADVGMIQRRGSLRLSPKTGERLGIVGHVIGQELERDEAGSRVSSAL
jgi:hypothetical protein